VSARQLFALGKYNEALELYGKLFAETAHPTYLRNIGRCYQNLGDPDKAISSFREYLRQATNLPADQRAVIDGYIREMEELKRKRDAESAPTVSVSSSAGRSQPTVTGTSAPPAPADTGGTRTAALVVAAASVAALGAGAVFGVLAIRNDRDADRLCLVDTCAGTASLEKNQAAVRDARISDVAFGAGILGAGVALYLFLKSPETGASPEATNSLRIKPEIGLGLAKVSAEARW
jgi:tetratricopeptide (TPR) repeat protein